MGAYDDQVVVVTGAGSGIGQASAHAFADDGATVVCVDLAGDALTATIDQLGGAGVPVEGSVAEPDTWRAVVDATKRAGTLAAAHLNAGVYGWSGAIEDLPDDVYRRTMAANVDGVVLGTRALVPVLRDAGGGAIVATASIAGLLAWPHNAVYTMTKHAVVGFVRSVAPMLVADGIGVSAVCPSIVDTPMTVEAAGGINLADHDFPLIPPSAVVAAVMELAAARASGICRAVLDHGSTDWDFPGWDHLDTGS
jgi:NAD(P)-dependent dehydrogenase (short-subunit alcohol dehydrogenase family)